MIMDIIDMILLNLCTIHCKLAQKSMIMFDFLYYNIASTLMGDDNEPRSPPPLCPTFIIITWT